MSTKDVIKNSVLNGLISGDLTNTDIIVVLGCSLFLGIYIYLIYKLFSQKSFYSVDLNITMAGMVIVTSAIMLAMRSNLIVSLGMVGALSIVRFRTAIKNPLDLLYMYWSISVGIINGVGLYTLAIELSVMMTIIIEILKLLPGIKAPQLIAITANEDVDATQIENVLKSDCVYNKKKVLSYKNGNYEAVFEVKCRDIYKVLDDVKRIERVKSINFLEHDGEMRV